MKLLIDECLPRKVKFLFAEGGHECETAGEAGFSSKENGELLALAEKSFDVLVTIDKNIRYQQNITGRKIAIVIIRAASNDQDCQARPDCRSRDSPLGAGSSARERDGRGHDGLFAVS